MIETLAIALPVFGTIALGYGAARLRKLPGEALAWLHFFVFYLALPAWFFSFTAEGAGLQQGWSFALTAGFATYCTFAVAFSLAALANRGHVPDATVQGLIGSYSNSGYMAPGLVLAAFGPAAGVPTALVFSVEYALFLVMVPLMMALGGAEPIDMKATGKAIARGVLLHPFILATIAGLLVAVAGFGLPAPLVAVLTFLREAAAPAALFALGIGLALRQPKRVDPSIAVMLGIKLFVHPLIVYLLLSWVGGFDPVWVYTAVLIAALPPAANVYVLARQHRTRVEPTAAAYFLGTVLSAVTVTLLVALIIAEELPARPFPL